MIRARAEGYAPPVEGESAERSKVREMLYAYEEAMCAYRHRPAMRLVKGRIEDVPQSYRKLLAAAVLADSLVVDYPTYLQAQFYWFNKWFNRPPKVYELASTGSKFSAPERVREYLRLKEAGEITCQRVVGVAQFSKVNWSTVDKINRQRMDHMCRVWGIPEEEVLRRFARPGVGYFDPQWLNKNITYLRLHALGEV